MFFKARKERQGREGGEGRGAQETKRRKPGSGKKNRRNTPEGLPRKRKKTALRPGVNSLGVTGLD